MLGHLVAALPVDGPKVKVAVLPEELLQLEPLLDLLPEHLQDPGAGGGPGADVAAGEGAGRPLSRLVPVPHGRGRDGGRVAGARAGPLVVPRAEQGPRVLLKKRGGNKSFNV